MCVAGRPGMTILYSFLAVVLAYLIGSISFAVVVSKLMGLPDPHSYGSRSPGATNVLRTGNKAAAVMTLIGDALKGWFAVWLAWQLAPSLGYGEGTVAMVAIAVFLGHLYPVFHKFAGGKGVATAAGILLAINVWLWFATVLTWLLIAVFFRFSSLASLISALFALFYYILLFGFRSMTLAIMVMSLLLVYRHRENIGRLLSGKESRIGAGKKA